MSVPGSTGVVAFTVPTFASLEQPPGAGPASKVAAGQALASVERRTGSCLGSVVVTCWMFAWPTGWLMLTSMLALLVREVFAPAIAPKVGLNASLLHLR